MSSGCVMQNCKGKEMAVRGESRKAWEEGVGVRPVQVGWGRKV